MVAKNITQLKSQMLSELKKAMQEASNEMLDALKKETREFYSMGNPTIYERTHNLENAPNRTPLSVGQSSVSFNVYLDTSVQYEVPNTAFTDIGYSSFFTTPQIFEAAETHTYHVKGKSGFWSRSEAEFQKILGAKIKSHFPQ